MTEISRGFPQFLRENTETNLKLRHNGFPPHHFQVIIHYTFRVNDSIVEQLRNPILSLCSNNLY
jgi:hypothetical protein